MGKYNNNVCLVIQYTGKVINLKMEKIMHKFFTDTLLASRFVYFTLISSVHQNRTRGYKKIRSIYQDLLQTERNVHLRIDELKFKTKF